ncbi:glycoside hydrolase family 2 protein [Zunongwangia endophytica]|uniref:Beta-glucuronidase n=1 Tax=Zunongwangia endophytica TaxID=1808945 RepID=A0ABV8H760_9FLAO|nr:glycoside hydrolase family 2 TIM barrel-domain containing protein [Zunongwangia endophytica]MDN3594795.1 glycoside hydrolase family 2 TIM barrel-domain containing protein [Zunongwangia endophytica]
MMFRKLFTVGLLLIAFSGFAQEDLIINTQNREQISLNGTWHYIIDPYETGFYNYRYKEKGEKDAEAYWNNPNPHQKTDRKEHGYSDKYSIEVPGDWNSQDDVFKYYEGTVWYQREFDKPELAKNEHVFLYFGAVNYEAHIYLNGKKLGMHKGGFTPFNFEMPSDLLQEKGNFLVVKVDNKRHKDEIPTLNTDWWNYGGITRDVKLVITQQNFIQQYALQLDQDQDIEKSIKRKKFKLSGHIKLNVSSEEKVTIEIPEIGLKEKIDISDSKASFSFDAKKIELWSPENPKLYEVEFTLGETTLTDQIGFRKVEVSGKEVLLNGKEIFMRGISLHEEVAPEIRRANSMDDANKLFGWVKDLNANMVRLAHYPHNEYMTRAADELGILVWSEIPVYWTIDFENKKVLGKAQKQLEEMIVRDQNKASIIIWSVGNETPLSDARNDFMKQLVMDAKKMDSTRLISAALEVRYNRGTNFIDDPLGEYTDIVSVNEYLGWYGDLPGAKENSKWETKYNKPLFFSETGAGAKSGFHADKETRWSEEFQEWYYEETLKMMEQMPDNFMGLSPWILVDFRSPKRNNPKYQEGWNRKGLIDNEGNKKKAFFTLKKYYEEKEKEYQD